MCALICHDAATDLPHAIPGPQKRASLPERCKPLLQLLDQLGAARLESHQYILHQARKILLSRIGSLPADKLSQLLEVATLPPPPHPSLPPSLARVSPEAAASTLTCRVGSSAPPQSSFAFIGIPELRVIPLTVLSRLKPVPTTFLKQLAQDPELFAELPSAVQRQVWELDKNLLQLHALPKVSEFLQVRRRRQPDPLSPPA